MTSLLPIPSAQVKTCVAGWQRAVRAAKAWADDAQ